MEMLQAWIEDEYEMLWADDGIRAVFSSSKRALVTKVRKKMVETTAEIEKHAFINNMMNWVEVKMEKKFQVLRFKRVHRILAAQSPDKELLTREIMLEKHI